MGLSLSAFAGGDGVEPMRRAAEKTRTAHRTARRAVLFELESIKRLLSATMALHLGLAASWPYPGLIPVWSSPGRHAPGSCGLLFWVDSIIPKGRAQPGSERARAGWRGPCYFIVGRIP